MKVPLRPEEKVIMEANFHWLQYLTVGILAAFGLLGLVGMLSNMAIRPTDEHDGIGAAISISVIFCGPFAYKWLSNKMKSYIVTNQRFFAEDGILFRSSVELPISKINDVSLRQGPLQRLFGTGDILVMTGNPKPTVLKYIDKPIEFREALGARASADQTIRIAQ